MRQTQTELLKVASSSVEMHVTESGFYHRAVTVGAIVCALARLNGRAHCLDVTALAGQILNYSPQALLERSSANDGSTKWEHECSLAFHDVLVKQGICLSYERSGRGIWQFSPNIAPETPDYSQLK